MITKLTTAQVFDLIMEER